MKDCPDKPAAGGAKFGINAVTGDRYVLANHVEDDEGYKRVQAQRAANRMRPTPKKATLADWVTPSSFAAIASDAVEEEHEDKSSDDRGDEVQDEVVDSRTTGVKYPAKKC